MGNEPASQKPSHSNLDAAHFKPGFLILLCLGLAGCRGVKRSDSGRSATGRTYVSTPASGLTVFMHAGSAKMKLYLKNTSALSQKSSKRSPSIWKFAPWRAYGFWYIATGSEDASASFATKEMQCSPVSIYAFSQDSLKGLAAVAGKEHRSRMEHPNSRKFVSSMHSGASLQGPLHC